MQTKDERRAKDRARRERLRAEAEQWAELIRYPKMQLSGFQAYKTQPSGVTYQRPRSVPRAAFRREHWQGQSTNDTAEYYRALYLAHDGTVRSRQLRATHGAAIFRRAWKQCSIPYKEHV